MWVEYPNINNSFSLTLFFGNLVLQEIQLFESLAVPFPYPLHIHLIPTYPQEIKYTQLESVRIEYSIVRAKHLSFYTFFPFTIAKSWGGDQFLHTHLHLSVVNVFWNFGNHWDLTIFSHVCLVVQLGGVAGSGKIVEDKSPEKFVGSQGLEGSSTLGILPLERICVFLYYNRFTSGQFLARKIVERFLRQVLQFSSSITHQVLSQFAYSLPFALYIIQLKKIMSMLVRPGR